LAFSTRAAQIFSPRILAAAARSSDQNESLLKNYITFVLSTCKAKSFRAPTSELIWEFCGTGGGAGARRRQAGSQAEARPAYFVPTLCQENQRLGCIHFCRNTPFSEINRYCTQAREISPPPKFIQVLPAR